MGEIEGTFNCRRRKKKLPVSWSSLNQEMIFFLCDVLFCAYVILRISRRVISYIDGCVFVCPLSIDHICERIYFSIFVKFEDLCNNKSTSSLKKISKILIILKNLQKALLTPTKFDALLINHFQSQKKKEKKQCANK